MKINLPYHTIETRTRNEFTYTDEVGQKSVEINQENWRRLAIKEIPLAFVNADNVKYTPKIDIRDNFLKNSKKLVRPYDTFTENDPYFFDTDKKLVSGAMKRIDGLYYYEPSNSTEFSPLTFNTYLELKKNQEYFNDTNYDIKVAVVDSSSDMSFAKTLISIFGDKYIYGDCPPNMKINGGAKTATSLISQDIPSADFVFVQSHDGFYTRGVIPEAYILTGDSAAEEQEITDEYDNLEALETGKYLEDHTNVWISVNNDYLNRFRTNISGGFNTTLTYNSPVLFAESSYTIKTDVLTLFDQSLEFTEDQFGNFPDIEYPCEAVLIIHRHNKGFIVISPSWFLEERLEETHKIVYEIMMRIYLKSYIKSNAATVWITDQPIDYLSYHEQRYGMRHSKISIRDLLPEYDSTIDIKHVMVTTPYVNCVGFSERGDILFKKTDSAPLDPVCPNGFLSFYTTKHTIMYYTPENLSLIEKPVIIDCIQQDNKMFVIVRAYLSSNNRVRTTEDQSFEVSALNKKYKLYVSEGSRDIENTFLLLEDNVLPEEGYSIVADISFSTTEKPIICDTRILGGGLPDAQINDYDMLDIGHVLGHPYRLGSALLISLPIRFNSYKERIKKELDKHIAAGDDYSLIFKQGEEE